MHHLPDHSVPSKYLKSVLSQPLYSPFMVFRNYIQFLKTEKKIQKEKRQVKNLRNLLLLQFDMVIKDHPILKMNHTKLIQKQL